MIDTMWLLTIACALVATIFGVLLTVLGWIGNKLYLKVEEIAATMHQIAGDLHGKISDLDRRQTRTEARLDSHINEHSGQ